MATVLTARKHLPFAIHAAIFTSKFSGTAAGSQFGVAKAANLIAVQVLNSAGSGSISGM